MAEDRTCLYTGCTRRAAGTIEIDLGERWDEITIIAPSARFHRVPLCADHLAYPLSDGTVTS